MTDRKRYLPEDVGLSPEQVEKIHEEADDDCGRCGGNGRVVKVVMGQEGMVPCPSCRGDKPTEMPGSDE